MAKPKGHRANKPNDSFGTINNKDLYKGKYKEEVYKEDEDETTTEQNATEEKSDPSEEATQDNTLKESFVEQKESKEVDYKKRYDDLKKHYDAKQSEWKQKFETMPKQETQPKGNLDDFKTKYPEVHEAVSELATNKAESQIASLKEQVDSLKKKEKELEKQKAFEELLRLQPTFEKLRKDQLFLDWLEVQPLSISDGIYKNGSDALWASRVIDLYYSDTGVKKATKPNKKNEDAATNVTSQNTREVAPSQQKKVWKASEIERMKPWDFEKLEKEIDEARVEGRIDFSS